MKKQKPSSSISDFLSGLPVFRVLPDTEIAAIANQLVEERQVKGTLLASQSKSAIDKVLIVKEGQLELFFEQDGEKSLKGLLTRGDIFGGISLLVNRGVSVRTVQVSDDAVLLTLPGEIFLDLCKRYDAFGQFFLEIFYERMLDKSYASSFEQGQVVSFLSTILPFSFLPEYELKSLSNALILERYKKDTLLFVQGSTIIDKLYIVKSGAIERYYEENGEKKLRGVLGEGDVYGGISMLVNHGLSVRSVYVREDTQFYTLAKERFEELCQTYDQFSEYFTDTFGKRMIDRSYAAIIKSGTESAAATSQFFNLRVQDIYHANLLSCLSHTSIQEAASAMSARGCSSIFIRDEQEKIIGVVTDNDFRKKVIAHGLDIQRPVSEIMSTPLYTIESEAMVSEALLAMMDTNLKHMGVTDVEGKVVGVLTNSDILSAQEQSPFFILREIASADTIDEIISKQRRVPRLIHNMINSGAKSRITTKLITKISDTILSKLIQFALKELGPVPTEFAFMVLGSEGRMEQTLKTDQDNAIIFAQGSGAKQAQIQAYFLQLGDKVCSWLDQAGYSFCKGEIMARNPQWCQPIAQWKSYFKKWIRVSTPKDLMEAAIFFDFRCAYGSTALVDELRLYLFEMLSGWTRFFRDLTVNALGFKPPIGFFRNFVLESKGQHRNQFNLKNAMTPIVDYARIYALFHNIAETNTQERLYHLYLRKILKPNDHNDLGQAYDYLMQQRLLVQIGNLENGESPENYMNPKKMARIEQTLLKEIFKRIEDAQSRLNLDFTGGIR